MNAGDKELSGPKRLLAWYNMVPNLLWSILNLVPISVYCYNMLPLSLLYTFIALGILPIFLPNSFLDSIQIGRTTAAYRRLGVGIVNKLAQNGQIINDLVRRRYPAHRIINYRHSSIKKLVLQTYMFEKFHLAMCVFFSLITIHALVKGQFVWAAAITLTNLLYNVYPNLLQQYIRLKLTLYGNRLKAG